MNEQIFWSPGVTLEAIEKQTVQVAFRHYRGNKTATANALGIAIRTLDSKLEKYSQDEKDEAARHERERKQRSEFLERQRNGDKPDLTAKLNHAASNIDNSPKPDGEINGGAASGVQLESAVKVATQQTVPVSERAKVQKVLPKEATKSNPK